MCLGSELAVNLEVVLLPQDHRQQSTAMSDSWYRVLRLESLTFTPPNSVVASHQTFLQMIIYIIVLLLILESGV